MRLASQRNYAAGKLDENMDSEIMEVILNEAREAFNMQIVIELQSNNTGDVESNVERIEQWVQQWKNDNLGEDTAR